MACRRQRYRFFGCCSSLCFSNATFVVQGAFNQSVIQTMSALNPRPIIFPLSNPVRLSECEFHEAVEWSNGNVLFASGSPFPEQEFRGRVLYPGQGA